MLNMLRITFYSINFNKSFVAEIYKEITKHICTLKLIKTIKLNKKKEASNEIKRNNKIHLFLQIPIHQAY